MFISIVVMSVICLMEQIANENNGGMILQKHGIYTNLAFINMVLRQFCTWLHMIKGCVPVMIVQIQTVISKTFLTGLDYHSTKLCFSFIGRQRS